MLYENLMEQNLVKIIRPYSHVQIHYVAQKIALPEPEVQKK
jgi:26S proteasome regulatory subunit N6